VGKITASDRPELIRQKGHNGNGFAGKGHKFHFESTPAGMGMDYRADISGFQAFTGQILS